MTDVFVIRNQLGHFWGKSKAWVDGSEPKLLLRTKHEDEAVNTLVELSTKDIELRGQVVPVALSERGHPLVEPSQNPLPTEPEHEYEATAEIGAETDGTERGEHPVQDAVETEELEPAKVDQ